MGEVALSDHGGSEATFCHGISLLLTRIDCRLATSVKEREAIFRLRYEAGMRDRTIYQRSSPNFSDYYDDAGNAYLLGLYIDDGLASSIRFHIGSKEQRRFPSLDLFPDSLKSELELGHVIIDCTRFVSDEHLSLLNRELPYATLRFCVLAAEHFKADYLITAVSPAHQAFYRRAFNYRPASEARLHPHLATYVRLMTMDYKGAADALYRRYPFFRSTPGERRKLFGYDS
jgi:hypothetical protein